MNVDWKPNRRTFGELTRRGLEPGTLLRFPGGQIDLAGTVNTKGGVCDDCTEHEPDEVPTHLARLVRLSDIDSRIEPGGVG